jgi:hypothetical protein
MGVLTKLNLMTRPRQTTGSVYATGQLLRPHQITTHFLFFSFYFYFSKAISFDFGTPFLKREKIKKKYEVLR